LTIIYDYMHVIRVDGYC